MSMGLEGKSEEEAEGAVRGTTGGGGQKYLQQKYSRRQPDTLRNTITWLLFV